LGLDEILVDNDVDKFGNSPFKLLTGKEEEDMEK
jgi:hypothetical protein